MPSEEQLEKALELMRRGEPEQRYFFENIKSSCWIKQLSERGFFTTPPAIRNLGTKVHIPDWPQSRYLARVAAQDPQLVESIFRKMKHTDNPRVYEAMAEAAIAMPVKHSKRLTRTLKKALSLEYQFQLPLKVAQLAVKLCSGGEVKDGTILLKALLQFESQQDETMQLASASDTPNALSIDIITRIGDYFFFEVIDQCISELLPHCPKEVFELLLGVGSNYLAMKYGNESSETWSDISRPSIIDLDEEDNYESVFSKVVDALRDAGSTYADKAGLEVVLQQLAAYPWPLMKRLAMHLMTYSNQPPQIWLKRLIVDRGNFDSRELRLEYRSLCSRYFHLLDEADRQEVESWLTPQLTADEIRERLGRAATELSDQGAIAIAEVWRRDEIAPFAAGLSERSRKEYERLREMHGHAKPLEEASYKVLTRWGSVSPLSEEKARSMSAREWVEYLSKWSPAEHSFDGPTVEGLGSTLQGCVKNEPIMFFKDAISFIGVQEIYIEHLLSGLFQGREQWSKCDWEPVLRLCEWVVSLEGEHLLSAQSDFGNGGGLPSLHLGIARLFSAGLGDSGVEPDIQLRSRIWYVLSKILSQCPPKEEFEKKNSDTEYGAYFIALNTVRGCAMEAIIRYLRWIYRNSGERPLSLSSMPEVFQLLSESLDVSLTPSLGVRAVYGRYAPWLVMVDQAWFEAEKDKVFPKDIALRDHWGAAWEAFILNCPPDSQTAMVLDAEFRFAIERSNQRTEFSHRRDADVSMGCYILALFGSGLLTSEAGSLLHFYLINASKELQRVTLAQLGRQVYDYRKEVKDSYLKQLEKLWRRFVEEDGAVESDDDSVLPAFGWWFAGRAFPEPWCLEVLKRAISRGSLFGNKSAIIETLESYASEYPDYTLDILSGLFQLDSNELAFRVKSTAITQLLVTVSKSRRDAVLAFLNELGSHGLGQYRDLFRSLRGA